jgi:hypothetical protein
MNSLKNRSSTSNYVSPDFSQDTLFALFKESKLTLYEISEKLCVSYECVRNQIYSKKIGKRIWIRYYQLFLNYIKK